MVRNRYIIELSLFWYWHVRSQQSIRHLFMIGPFGAGKSTIGRLLSEVLALPFLDLDREIESQTGVGLDWLVDKEGEAGYRKRERDILSVFHEKDQSYIIATGGGTVLDPLSAELIQKGFVVYLTVDLTVQTKRTAKRQEKRPLLQSKSLPMTNKERTPRYAELAHVEIATDIKPPKEIVTEIASAFSRFSIGKAIC